MDSTTGKTGPPTGLCFVIEDIQDVFDEAILP
jgi:hypothetical protein